MKGQTLLPMNILSYSSSPLEARRNVPIFETKEARTESYLSSGMSESTLVMRILRLKYGTGPNHSSLFDREYRNVLGKSTSYKDVVEQLVALEISEKALITDWAVCVLCERNKHVKTEPMCRKCRSVDEIRALLPKDFETKIHIPVSEYNSFLRMTHCLHGASTSSEIFHQLHSKVSTEDWAHYYFNFVGNLSDPEIAARPPCQECIEAKKQWEMSEIHVEALRIDSAIEARRERQEAKKKKLEENQLQCKACNRVFLKVANLKVNTSRNSTAYDELKLCGSCVSALVAGPRFEEFLKVMLDEAYERAAILWVIPEKKATEQPHTGEKDTS